jgi:hypothetical protein
MLPSALARHPEVELLLCCARNIRFPELTAKITSLLQDSMDWEYLLRTAQKHGVAPLLYWHLNATCPEAVPTSALDRLRAHFRANNLRNLFLTGELLKLLSEFGAHGIPVVPYKGPALAASVYGNLGLREFKDLDILVHKHDVPKAKDLLASMGYQARYRLTRTQEAGFLQSQCEHPFVRDDGKAIVELHWEITERHFFPFDTEHLWERLTRIPLGGDIVLSPSPEDMLLILCVHGSRHAWERLAWICDVAELVRVRQDIGWERVIAQASALGGERMLLLGLLLANNLVGTTLPEKVWQRVRNDPRTIALVNRVCEQLFQDTEYLNGSRDVYEGAPAFHALHLGVRERLQDKIRYCVRKAITLSGEDWELLPLPRFLFPLYSMLRPIRLTWKYGPRLLKRFL